MKQRWIFITLVLLLMFASLNPVQATNNPIIEHEWQARSSCHDRGR